jgi:hypothetical protein
MNREQIIRMARNEYGIYAFTAESLAEFATIIAAAEREACSELVVRGTDEPVQTKTLEILRKERERIAAAIRARSK